MSDFERVMPAYRLAQIRRGDTLRAIAYRELGDANRWPELVWINNLIAPYVTDNAGQATSQVLLAGDLIKIPSPSGVADNKTTEVELYGADLALTDGRLSAVDGDFALVAGRPNLLQQLGNAVETPRGQLQFHPDYGCKIHALKGAKNNAVAASLGAGYVKAVVMADYRISSVTSAVAVVSGDKMEVTVKANALNGGGVELTRSLS